jgi:hypothetical protein
MTLGEQFVRALAAKDFDRVADLRSGFRAAPPG